MAEVVNEPAKFVAAPNVESVPIKAKPCRATRRRHKLPINIFNLWKDADPDIPILKQAKAEYAKLQ